VIARFRGIEPSGLDTELDTEPTNTIIELPRENNRDFTCLTQIGYHLVGYFCTEKSMVHVFLPIPVRTAYPVQPHVVHDIDEFLPEQTLSKLS
jgi:hypothetical protein